MKISPRLLILVAILALAACSDADDNGPGGGASGDAAGGGSGVDTVASSDAPVFGPGADTVGAGADTGSTGAEDTGSTGTADTGPAADVGTTSPEDVSTWTPPDTPSIAIDPLVHTFSYISPLTSPMVRQINIGNMGQSPLHVDAIEFTAASSTDYAWVLKPTTPKTLAPGKWTMFEVRFACDVMGGPCNNADGFIEVISDDPQTPVSTITLTSQIKATIATPEPCGLLTPSSLNFGSVTRGEFKTLQATLTNCGETDALTVHNVTRSTFLFMALTDEFEMDLEGQTPLTLGPGDSQVINV
ncbi:MAG: hypothetical protein QF464_12795, partial [Myxococcota bacterium]|nr:hypothetical protein [Myxococcota bacterium]